MTTTLPRRRSAVVAMIAALAVILGGTYAAAQPPPAQNLWGTTVPANPALSWDGKSTELGVRFTVTAPGRAIGVRFYRGTGNDGVHKGYLYQGTVRKAEVTFTNETPTGWQEAFFATPVDLTAGTAYTASYLAPKGHYADDSPMTYPKTSGIIKATGAAYKYGTGGTYPSNNVPDENYYADVIVAPTGTPPTTTTPAPTTTTAPPVTTTTEPPTTTTDPTTPPVTTTPTPPAGCPNATPNVPDGPDGKGGCFPGPATTGVPTGVALTPYTGPCTITAANAVIDAQTINCALDIRAQGVKITRSRITAPIQTNGGTLTVEDSEVDASPGAPAPVTGIGSDNFTVRRTEVVGGNRSIDCHGNCVVEDSYVHGQKIQNPWHASGIRMSQHGRLTHNTIWCEAQPILPEGGCSADQTGYPDFEPTTDWLIERNLYMANPTGNGYCAYGGGTGNKPYSGDPLNATNIRYMDNVFQRGGPNEVCGDFGPITDFRQDRPGNQWAGNVWDNGAVVPPG